MQMIAIVMGAPTKDDRMADATKLLNDGFANFAPYTPDLTEVLTPIPVAMGTQDTVALTAEGMGTVVVEKERAGGLTMQADLPEALEAPVEAGTQIGSGTVRDGEETVCTIPIKTAESVERLGFSEIFARLGRVLLMQSA